MFGQAYDVQLEPYRAKIASAIRANDRAAFVQTLQDAGILQAMTPGQSTVVY